MPLLLMTPTDSIICRVYFLLILLKITMEEGNIMKNCLYIGVFGFFGAILRYFIKNIHIYHYAEKVPINTIIINVTGSFILALILTIAFEVWEIREEIRLGIATGFLGAYTTFSTLCKDTVTLINGGLYFSAINYITVTVLLGLCAVYFGIVLAREFISKIISKGNYDEVRSESGVD